MKALICLKLQCLAGCYSWNWKSLYLVMFLVSYGKLSFSSTELAQDIDWSKKEKSPFLWFRKVSRFRRGWTPHFRTFAKPESFAKSTSLVWKLELDCNFSVKNYKHSSGLVRYSDVTIEPKLFTLYSVGGWSQPLPCAIHWIAFNDIKPIRSLGGDVTLPVLQGEKNDLTFFPLLLSTLGTTQCLSLVICLK